MCGIVGFTGEHGPELLRNMNDAQRHRGPDDEGYFTDLEAGVSLAMRRLSIQDIALGRQPMQSPNGEVVIVFNGEIFNANYLRQELNGKGSTFFSRNSDTEVLLQLYLSDGTEMVKRLRGMFAFVIYDKAKRQLFGARDQTGIKPLYISLTSKGLTFASELKSFKCRPDFSGELNNQAVFDYFSFQCIPGDQSIFNGINRLPPGSIFVYSLDTNSLAVQKYWTLRNQLAPRRHLDQNPESQIRTAFDNAVKNWSQSDVPIACSLSGGIDSAAIVGSLASQGLQPISTFTLRINDAPELDESKLAEATAKMWGTSHQEIAIKATDLLTDLDAMMTAIDEPYAGGLPSWFVFKAIGAKYKVAMTGTGGDELFGNYGKWLRYESIMRRARYQLGILAREGFSSLRYPIGSIYSLQMRQHTKLTKLFTKDFHDSRPSEELVEQVWSKSIGDSRDRVAQVDFQIQLPCEFLHMTDRFSMAHHVEARTPFLDTDLIKCVMSIHSSQRTSRLSYKGLFTDAISDYLPNEVRVAPKKGFVLPMRNWLRRELRDECLSLLNHDYLQQQNIFKPAVFKEFVEPHLSNKRDFTKLVWNMLMFQKWYQRWVLS